MDGGKLTAKEIATFQELERVLDAVDRKPKTPVLVVDKSTPPPKSQTKNFADVHTTSVRKLVTVRRIKAVQRIVGSQKNVALLDGWQVVVDRDANFTRGELVVFCQADTFLPEATFKAVHAQLGVKVTSWKNERGYGMVTRPVSNRVSQGRIFHLRDFPEIQADVYKSQNTAMEKDYAGVLGVKSWFLKGGKVLVPAWIRNSKTPRLEMMTSVDNMPMLHTEVCQESVLMDGHQMTCYFVSKQSPLFNSLSDLAILDPHSMCESGCFGVCGPSSDLRFRAEDIYWQAALHYGLKDKLAALNKSIAVTGELVGSTIKGNPHGYAKGEHEFLVYDVFDIETQERWNPRAVEAFVSTNGLEHVPVRGYYVVPKIARDNDDLLVRANLQAGFKGLVYKNVETGKWFKVKSERYARGAGLGGVSVCLPESFYDKLRL